MSWRMILAAFCGAWALFGTGCDDRARAGEASGAAAGTASRETVIVLHGLGRSSRSMATLAERLEDAGYSVHNVDYPSLERPIEQLIEALDARLGECCAADAKLHFVTHSMGGVLMRAWAQQDEARRLGRVVMLSPPNHGSEIVDVLGASPLFEWVLGPAAVQLGTDAESAPRRILLPSVGFEVGVITGDRSVNPLGSWLIDGPDDGAVSVESARLDGLEERGAFLVVPRTHTFIMSAPEVAREVVHFLRAGRFSAEALSGG